MKRLQTFLMIAFTAVFLVLFASLASAALDLTITSVPTTVEHDDGTVQVLFTLINTGSSAETELTWTRTTNVGQWTTVPSITQIEAGATLPLSATLTFLANASGNIVAELKVRANSGAEDTISLNIPITNTAKLEITSDGQTDTRTVSAGQSVPITVKNIGNTNLNNVVLSATGDFTVSFSDSTLSLGAGTTQTVTAAVSTIEPSKFGVNTVTITARDNAQNAQDTFTLTQATTFCRNGSIGGNLEITDLEIDNQGDGDDDSWQFLDVIEVTVTVENNGNDDEFGQNTEVHLGLFDSTGKNQISDLEFENTDEEKIE